MAKIFCGPCRRRCCLHCGTDRRKMASDYQFFFLPGPLAMGHLLDHKHHELATILDAGDITPKQASALFDVALGEFPFFADCAQAVAYNHSGIISPVRLEGKQRTCGCEVRRAVGHLCNLLSTALNERERSKFKAFTPQYIAQR